MNYRQRFWTWCADRVAFVFPVPEHHFGYRMWMWCARQAVLA